MEGFPLVFALSLSVSSYFRPFEFSRQTFVYAVHVGGLLGQNILLEYMVYVLSYTSQSLRFNTPMGINNA
ncbi:hypothetical protein OUZ56_004611 [Daphnia magna]|uniref:Uncharacterized protein n=1 Tax=Daphnia magna TaxID=35525 RepID=A0ABQ9YQB0_9CRUS|nr:hypothetical protein OUZ56_004611 [Daphnia magna]